MDDDLDTKKVVSLQERLKGRRRPEDRIHLRAEMVTITAVAVERMGKLGATPEEITAQLQAAIRALGEK